MRKQDLGQHLSLNLDTVICHQTEYILSRQSALESYVYKDMNVMLYLYFRYMHILYEKPGRKWLNSSYFHALLNTTPLKVMMYANEHGLLILASP